MTDEKKTPDLFDQPPQFGTPAHMLHRRESPDTSVAAAHSVDSTKLEKMVSDFITSCGAAGCISDDVTARFHDFAYSSITARYSSLERKGFIACGPDKRPGRSGRQQRVMRGRSP